MTRQQQIEEKAKEIGRKWYYDNTNPNDAAYRAALQMAQWADKQEIEFLYSLLFQSVTYHIFDKINERIKLLKGE